MPPTPFSQARSTGNDGYFQEDFNYSDMFMAARDGKIGPFKKYAGSLHELVSLAGDTILHIYLSSPKERCTKFVEDILEICPLLLLQKNDVNGDIPLHIAARHGHDNIVQVLIEEAAKAQQYDVESGIGAARQMLRMTNKRKQTALHEAARNCGVLYSRHSDVVGVLAKADPDFPYSVDDSGETPLYMAANRGNLEVVSVLLNTCNLVAYSGPNGKTALHAAVMRGHGEIVDALLQRKGDLGIEVDNFGWTPLHYAAYGGFDEMVEKLLEYDKKAAYIVDNDRKRTALHLAACQDHRLSMEKISNQCPDSCNITDARGWNVAHYAAISKDYQVLQEVLTDPSNIHLINMKDSKGNTPLHLFVASFPPSFDLDKFLNGNFELNYHLKLCGDDLSKIHMLFSRYPQLKKETLEWMEDVIGSGPFGQITITLKDDFVSKREEKEAEAKAKAKASKMGKEEKRAKRDLILERASNVHTVVAVLIATVTFAAAFTIPGGLKTEMGDINRGSPLLSKSSAFQAFVITDALAFVLSTCSVFIHFLLVLTLDEKRHMLLLRRAFYLTCLDMATMVVAFLTGTYAVLAPSSGLSIITCFIVMIFFVFLAFAFPDIVNSWFHLLREKIPLKKSNAKEKKKVRVNFSTDRNNVV